MLHEKHHTRFDIQHGTIRIEHVPQSLPVRSANWTKRDRITSGPCLPITRRVMDTAAVLLYVASTRSKVASSFMNPKLEPWPLLQQAVALPPPYIHRLGRDAIRERRETLAAETVPHGPD